jgi:glycosyltransferase involved in cell wall biosynthesis
VRILIVSQMYPGPADPDLGIFVQGLERALEARGHEVARAVVDRRAGGVARNVELARRTRAASRSFRPEVVYAHFLVPAGLIAAVGSRAPLVVTAHGQDVRNAVGSPTIRRLTRHVCQRASAVIAVSDYLRRTLEGVVPEARGKTDVIDCGIDLDLFVVSPAPSGSPAYLSVGTLDDRKNPVRLAEAFARLGEQGASLTFVGDGPLRPLLEGRSGILVTGRVSHERVRDHIAASHVVCQPSLVEPFGQALVEAMACGRSVVATAVGGPPEFVTPDAGVLVDPLDVGGIADGLRRAAELPCPNPAARAVAESHDVRRRVEQVEAVLVGAAGR